MRDWLKEIRKSTGMTTYTAAKKLGISQSLYSSIENGSRGVSIKNAKKIAALFQFDWVEFYDEEKEAK